MEQFRQLVASVNKKLKLVIEDKLRYLARLEDGQSAPEEEFKRVELNFQINLHPKAEDPFKVVARHLNGSANSWDMAALAFGEFAEGMRGRGPNPFFGWLGTVVAALADRQPLPCTPKAMCTYSLLTPPPKSELENRSILVGRE